MEAKMFAEVEFNGVVYYCRRVKDKDGQELIIGDVPLKIALETGRESKKANWILDEIFFFVEEEDLQLPDEQLIEVLKRDNHEWF